jgi:hypothetical protein
MAILTLTNANAAGPTVFNLVSGRSYTCLYGATVQVPDYDALLCQGWTTVQPGAQPTGTYNNTPVTGFSITIPNGTPGLVLTPGGTLATGAVILPAIAVDGFVQRITTSAAITTLTVTANTGQTLAVAYSTTLAAAATIAFQYAVATATWTRVQ